MPASYQDFCSSSTIISILGGERLPAVAVTAGKGTPSGEAQVSQQEQPMGKTQENSKNLLNQDLKNHYKKDNLPVLWLPKNTLETHVMLSRGPLLLIQLASLGPGNNTELQRLAAPREAGSYPSARRCWL